MNLVVIPLDNRPIFPGLAAPLVMTTKAYIDSFKYADENMGKNVGLLLTRSEDMERPSRSDDFFEYGTLAKIIRFLDDTPDGPQVILQVIRRFQVKEFLRFQPHIVSRVHFPEDICTVESQEKRALVLSLLESLKTIVKENPLFTAEMKVIFPRLTGEEPGKIADLSASITTASREELQKILETMEVGERMKSTLFLLKKEIDILKLQQKIKKQIESKISKHQRVFFLKEQMKAIKQELGLEQDPKLMEVEKFKKRIESVTLPENAAKVIEEEIQKLSLLEPLSPEFNVSRSYLDWLTVLPWDHVSDDQLDLQRAQKILDEDHYGLDDVKRRIIEFMAVRKLQRRSTGSILCFVGPPGVGKTSMGRSVARTLNRTFFRFSLGGMRDEAEIKGHRRTYIGAMPGKIIQALKVCGTANPVIMLDEVDKLGQSFQGDPSSALLEVLDPEQNTDFRDHYLDVGFDLSRILFITTANTTDTIPPPLLDRMELMKLPGYIAAEKRQIAKKFLLPKQIKKHGLKSGQLNITGAAFSKMINGYAREAGVRNLEKEIAKICRKVATRIAEGQTRRVSVSVKNLEDLLGRARFEDDALMKKLKPGVATGLAWTSLGGTVLYVEAIGIPSDKSGFKQTGQLGGVMVESSTIAYDLIKSRAGRDRTGSPNFFDHHFIHLHVPAGATPKDGPSAGLTMAVSLLSLHLGKTIRKSLAMTGELTLTGRILPVGGVKEKIIAAKRAGIKEVMMPTGNKRDYAELPDNLTKGMTFHLISSFDEAVEIIFK